MKIQKKEGLQMSKLLANVVTDSRLENAGVVIDA